MMDEVLMRLGIEGRDRRGKEESVWISPRRRRERSNKLEEKADREHRRSDVAWFNKLNKRKGKQTRVVRKQG